MKDGVEDFSLNDFKKNLDFFSKRTKIKKVILTGGEPTLHPDLLKILSHLDKQKLAFSIVTNAIRFASHGFLKKTEKYFINNPNSNIVFSLNSLPDEVNNQKEQKIAKKRIKGIIELAKSKIPLSCTVTVTQENKKYLNQIFNFLIDLKKEYNFNLKGVELRMLYSSLTPDNLFKENFINPPLKVSQLLEQSLSYLDENKVNYVLWNFPLCYLKNPKKYKHSQIKERLETVMTRIDVNHQYDKRQLLDWSKQLKKHPECLNCSLVDYCSGIESNYLKLYNYPRLKTIK